MRKINPLFFSLLFSLSFAQMNEKVISKDGIGQEIIAAKKDFYTDTEKSLNGYLKIYKDSKFINYTDGILTSTKYLIKIYLDIGQEDNVLAYCEELEKIAKQIKDDESLYIAYEYRANAFTNLGMYKQSREEFQKALGIVNKYQNGDKRHYHLSSLYQSMLHYFEATKNPQDSILLYLNKALKEADRINDNSKEIHPDYKYDMLSYLNMNLGMFYVGVHQPKRLDLAERYLQQSLNIINAREFTKIKVKKTPILSALARFYIEKGDFEKSLEYAYENLAEEKKMKSPHDRMIAYATLTNAYEGLNRKDSIIKYMALYTNLSDSINYGKKMAVQKTIEKVNKKNKAAHQNNIRKILMVAVSIILLMVFLGFYFWYRNQKILRKKHQLIINELKNESHKKTKENTEKSILIADETLNTLLLKLSKFEESKKFLRQDMSLTYLANSLNTNTRYLSEIINQHRGKNFYNYLNHLRIQYITELLFKEPKYREYKISYLAEISGFTSREVFSSIFKKETGVTPSYFINNLRKEENEL